MFFYYESIENGFLYLTIPLIFRGCFGRCSFDRSFGKYNFIGMFCGGICLEKRCSLNFPFGWYFFIEGGIFYYPLHWIGKFLKLIFPIYKKSYWKSRPYLKNGYGDYTDEFKKNIKLFEEIELVRKGDVEYKHVKLCRIKIELKKIIDEIEALI